MRLRVGRAGETVFYLHLGAVVFLLYGLMAGQGALMAAGTVSILAHEGAHALISALLGYPPREIEFTPLGAVMRLDQEEAVPPLKRLLVLLAGPLTTLGLCALALAGAKGAWLPLAMARVFFLTNLSLLLLNLLPALPLDGGRMLALLAGLALRPSAVRVMMRILGGILGLSCIAGNVLVTWRVGGWNLSLAAAGCFLLYAASTASVSTPLAELRGFMDRKIRMERRGIHRAVTLAAMDSQSLRRAVLALHPWRPTVFCLMDEGLRMTGVISEEQVIHGYLSAPGDTLRSLAREISR